MTGGDDGDTVIAGLLGLLASEPSSTLETASDLAGLDPGI
jgi:hypothetical protein